MANGGNIVYKIMMVGKGWGGGWGCYPVSISSNSSNVKLDQIV